MDIFEIRKANLIRLIGSRRKGACAEKWEMAPAHLSQVLSNKTAKNLGEDVARRIEQKEGLPHGWLDALQVNAAAQPTIEANAEIKKGAGGLTASEHSGSYGAAAKVMEMLSRHGKSLTEQAQQRLLDAVSETLTEVKSGNVIPGNFSRSARVQDGDILIPQYDVRASMGHGQVPADYVEFVRNVVVNGLQLEKLGLEYTSPANLSIITGWGQSMAGTIDDKDPVIVDRGITEFNGDGVYVLTWDGMLYIKRLQKADADHFDMISDNEKHKDRVVPVGDVTIHARVLYVWKGQKL